VLKLVQVMTVKGLVERDKGERPQVYYAALSERRTKRGLIRDFIERVFSGSAKDLIAHALGAKKSTPSELTEIRKLLDKLE
jgi:predicted transcriptional regulator